MVLSVKLKLCLVASLAGAVSMATLSTAPAEYNLHFTEAERLQILAALRYRVSSLELDKVPLGISIELVDTLARA